MYIHAVARICTGAFMDHAPSHVPDPATGISRAYCTILHGPACGLRAAAGSQAWDDYRAQGTVVTPAAALPIRNASPFRRNSSANILCEPSQVNASPTMPLQILGEAIRRQVGSSAKRRSRNDSSNRRIVSAGITAVSGHGLPGPACLAN